MGPSSAAAPPPSTPLGRLFTWAVVGNVVLATGGWLLIAPVSATQAALDLYDGLPEPVRRLMGDDKTATATEDQAARGPVGRFLERFYHEAVAGDVGAQLRLPLDVASDPAPDAWTAATQAVLTWETYRGDLSYRAATTKTAAPPADDAWTYETDAGSLIVPLSSGTSWIHVQALDGDDAGPITSLGPYRVDDTPPSPPLFSAGLLLEVDDFHYAVAWRAAQDDSGIVGYRLEKSLTGTSYETLATTDGSVTSWNERNQPKGTYWYRIIAINGAGLESRPSAPLEVDVNPRTNLRPPDTGGWHYGINATYDSVIHVWDISRPERYLTLSELRGPGHGGLTDAEYARYTGTGWGVTTDNATLRAIAQNVVGSETNSLRIAIALYEWLFNATDYDFAKFAATESNFLKANEVYDAGKGICGDLTSLYLTMLRIAGVPARPVHGYLINQEDGIGGFHMWAEVYVGGTQHDPTGNGWIPVDVSGVTGTFEPKYLDIYFGIANPSYLQLGIQEDLGDPDDPDDPNSKWNVWANLKWEYRDTGNPPDISFDADATLTEVATNSQGGRLYFDDATHRRVFCATDERDELEDPSCGRDYRMWFDGLKSRSVRKIDYGADLGWTSRDVNTLWLKMKMPETPGANQVVIYTVYQHNDRCSATKVDLGEPEDGFLTWQVDGAKAPCSR